MTLTLPSPAAHRSPQRRLLIGLGATAVFGALALQPDSALRGTAAKPLFFYLVPVLRVQARSCPGSPPLRAPAALGSAPHTARGKPVSVL